MPANETLIQLTSRGGPAVSVLVALGLFAGCGGPSGAEKAAARQRTEDARKQARTAAAKAKAERDYGVCQSQLGPLFKALADLKGHLEVGLSYSEYTQRLGDARVAYDEIPFKSMAPGCLSPGILAEDAINEHARAATYWGGCIDSLECAEATKEHTLQAHWSKADGYLERAESRLEAMKQPEDAAVASG